MIEHLKETNTSWHNSHSFGMNFGTMLNFANIPSVTSGMMAVPVDRKVSSSSVHESYAQSGMYIKENHIKIGEKIEIKPELENHEYLKVRDTSIINHIGGIASGVQEIKENLEAIQKPHHHDIIIDAEPVDFVQEHKEEKPVFAVDADPKTPDSQVGTEPDYAIHEQETRQLLDEIYDTDIAPYHEFESIQRPESPDRVETELTKAVAGVIDHASELEKNVNCYTKAVFQVVGYVSDAFLAPLKPVNEHVISPALDALDTRVRRTLRDDCRFPQGFAQDAGDVSSIVAGLLIPCRISKIPGKITKLKVPDRVAQRKVGNVGRYKDLTTPGGFNDGKDAHHMPSQKYLRDNGLNTKEGLSVIMEKKLHRKTRTYGLDGSKINTTAKYRDELATDLKDYKKVLQGEGVWKERIKDLIDGLDKYKKDHQELFKKEQK